MRILYLVLIPLLSLVGLYVFVASITLGDARSEARVNSLQNDTGQPIGNYEAQVDLERQIAVIFLAAPTPDRLAQLDAQAAKTDQARSQMDTTLTSRAITSKADKTEKQAIATLLTDASHMGVLRSRVASHAIGRDRAMAGYDQLAADCESALREVILEQNNPALEVEGLALLQMGDSESALLQEDTLVKSDLAARTFSLADHRQFAQLVGARRALLAGALPNLSPGQRQIYARDVNQQASASLASLEDALIADTHTSGPPQIPPATWQADVAAVSGGFSQAGTESATDIANRAKPVVRNIYLRFFLAGGLGLIAVIVSIFVSIWIGRGLVRQLADLRRSALVLASERLPQVVRRLRAGEDVDVSAEAPPIETSSDEIGQVSRAFNAAARTAIEATLDQARLRRGVSEVFRNLARRSQSLLHRELTLLDAMERRTTDPDELADLYRLDHLTTRMRRHAEGLIILSGAAPGRAWRNPVRLIDVLRAAIAEIEDYTRVTVNTMTQAALAGSAVADVIHLIAELVENATMFSPPNTNVRITGDMVGKGFAIEIEDRGLGMSQEKLAEINHRLTDSPEFDLSDSDQLGLFVAGRLALRHDIQVSLRANAYGGTTAVVLVPRELVVPEETYAKDGSATMAGEGSVLPTGRHASRGETLSAVPQASPPDTPPAETEPPGAQHPAGSHPYPGPETPRDGIALGGSRPAPVLNFGGSSLDDFRPRGAEPPDGMQPADGSARADGSAPVPAAENGSTVPASSANSDTALPRSDTGLAGKRPDSTSADGDGGGPGGDGHAGGDAEATVPGAGGPAAGASPPGGPPTAGIRDGALNASAGPVAMGNGAAETSDRPVTVAASEVNWFRRSGKDRWRDSDPPGSGDSAAATADLTELGLPQRVRQAHLAPQLRGPGPSRHADGDDSFGLPSPEAARATMAAIQRGFARGRSAFPPPGADPERPADGESHGNATDGSTE